MNLMKKILVTGGAGFIGSHLVEALVESRAHVTVVDNLQRGTRSNLKAVLHDITFVESDLLDAFNRRIVQIESFDTIFHLAGNSYVPPSVTSPDFDYFHNLQTSFALLEHLRNANALPRLVFVSSAAVYGNPLHVPISEMDLTVPISPYGVSKLAVERYIEVYSLLYKIPAVSLRLFSVFGPRQPKQVIYDFMCKLRENHKILRVLGDGTQQRDFNYVTNVVDAMLLLATEAPFIGEVYNVASGKTHSIANLVQELCEVLELEPHVEYSGSVRPGDAEIWKVDISKITSLGYSPKMMLREGLKRTADWFEGVQV